MLAFFGLTPEYKKIVLEEVFALCFHSQGGFSHDEVYDMPIRYRHFYLHKLTETLQKQKDEIDKNLGNSGMIEDGKSLKPSNIKNPPPIPDFAFTAKAPKK